MNAFQIAENITRLRGEMGITQSELAQFLGVTKASVSKWETGQSYPDITIIPQLAAYFDVSIDALMGYQPQLSQNQIEWYYQQFMTDFASKPNEEVLNKSKILVKKYYSCYPLLYKITILWLNHYQLFDDSNQQIEIMEDILDLCKRIVEQSNDIGLVNDTLIVMAMTNLILGRADQTIDILQPIKDPKRLSIQSDGLLIQAYQSIGETDKADCYNQIFSYLNVLNLVTSAMNALLIRCQEKEYCKEVIKRTTTLIQLFHLDHINENICCQFYYQVSITYCTYGEVEEATRYLKLFTILTKQVIQAEQFFHGDNYFDRIEQWMNDESLLFSKPRSKEVMLESVRQGLNHPAFSVIAHTTEYHKCQELFE